MVTEVRSGANSMLVLATLGRIETESLPGLYKCNLNLNFKLKELFWLQVSEVLSESAAKSDHRADARMCHITVTRDMNLKSTCPRARRLPGSTARPGAAVPNLGISLKMMRLKCSLCLIGTRRGSGRLGT